MAKSIKKENLPKKTCPVCKLEFSWRKKWELEIGIMLFTVLIDVKIKKIVTYILLSSIHLSIYSSRIDNGREPLFKTS